MLQRIQRQLLVGTVGAWLAVASLASASEPSTGLAWAADSDSETAQSLDEPNQVSDPPAQPTEVHSASFQDQPPLLPRREIQPDVALPESARRVATDISGGIGQSLLSGRWGPVSREGNVDIVSGAASRTRVTTDAGSLLGKSPSALGVGIQRRTPIVNDPRVRGSRVGQLAASGSHWVPARIDLDTILSKIDSRLVESLTVIKGPYSVRNGAELDFVEVLMLPSPRFPCGPTARGATSFDFQGNGEQWYGRQTFLGGSDHWGFRIGYGQRTGNDYRAGNGLLMPASYKSRNIDFALGRDLSPDASIEVNALRLDQTDVEYPGMAFDMDFLVTDGYDLEYVRRNQWFCDRVVLDAWYNRTRFDGNAQSPAKRKQFPFFDQIDYVGFTDVDSMSTGFQMAMSWGDEDTAMWTVGVETRYVQQELNEISSGRIGFNIFKDANSPIPQSEITQPALFLERFVAMTDRWTVNAGFRFGWAASDIIEDPAELQHLGIQQPQSSAADILGTSQFAQNRNPWAIFLTNEYELDDDWSVLASVGYGQRPASLTELYVCQSFLFLLQNGQNTATGDPRLRPEKSLQIDLGFSCDGERFRGGVNGFYAWVNDYITFENIGVVRGPPSGQVEQVNLKYVNTQLATLLGFEGFAEYDLTPRFSPFATVTWVQGRDLTRNGDFATRPATPGNPSQRVYGLPRGFFSGVPGPATEPLPGILPFESRVGVRWHQAGPIPKWSVELAARLVDNQWRVANSLLETTTPGFIVWDLRAYCRPTDRLTLLAGVENLFDRTYREHLDFRSENGIELLQPGVNGYCGAEIAY